MENKRTSIRFLSRLGILALFLMLLVVISEYWPVSTPVNVSLTANRVVFTLGGTDPKAILNSIDFQSVVIEKFLDLKLAPARLKVADPQKYILTKQGGRYPESAWVSLSVNPPVIVKGIDETSQPFVVVESAQSNKPSNGALGEIIASPGSQVVMEVRGEKKMYVTITLTNSDNKSFSGSIVADEALQITTNNCLISGTARMPYNSDSLTYIATLTKQNPYVEINGEPCSFALTVEPSGTDIFPKKVSIPVTSLDFIRQDNEGNVITALVNDDGEISYPTHPKINKIPLKQSEFITLKGLDKFSILEISLHPENKGILLSLSGYATHISTGSLNAPIDHSISYFAIFKSEPEWWGVIAAFLAALYPGFLFLKKLLPKWFWR